MISGGERELSVQSSWFQTRCLTRVLLQRESGLKLGPFFSCGIWLQSGSGLDLGPCFFQWVWAAGDKCHGKDVGPGRALPPCPLPRSQSPEDAARALLQELNPPLLLLLLFISCYACNNSGAFQTEKLQALPQGAHNLKVDKGRDEEKRSTEHSRGQGGNQP